MKVLVLGANSFLAKEIKNYFFNYNFTFLARKQLDLENDEEVNKYFNNNNFDFVINTCVVGGKRDVEDNFNVLLKNIKIFNNLLNNKKNFSYLFNFCSGAAFDRKRSINSLKEKEIFNSYPEDYYGLSKNIISKESLRHKNIYTFRVFGCFGIYEDDSRFVKSCLKYILNNQDIVIFKDKYLDYISAKDLCKILEYYMKNINILTNRDINIVYNTKYKLSDIANKILSFKQSNKSVIILENGLDNCYTGDSTNLSTIPIKLTGLENSLKEMITCLT